MTTAVTRPGQHGGHHPKHPIPEGGSDGLNAMAANATLHCITGCAIGEVLGLMIGTAAHLNNLSTIALAVSLAFIFGFSLSTLPLLRAGLSFLSALAVVLAADTLSIATMEVVDNAAMAAIPGAMDARLSDSIFWVGMTLALAAAFVAAFPVNRYLLARGKGHTLTHQFHRVSPTRTGWRRFVPAFRTTAVAGVLVGFILGGFVAAAGDEIDGDRSTKHSDMERGR
jgi:Domain of unknown function (DUF4396)